MRHVLVFITLTCLALAGCAADTAPPTEPGPGTGDDGSDTGGGGGGGDTGGVDAGAPDEGGQPPDGGSTSACAAPGAVGNEQGVGEYCTPDGGECEDNDGAGMCTVDYQADAPPFCTKICSDDADCGADAVCTSDGGPIKACVPTCVVEGGA